MKLNYLVKEIIENNVITKQTDITDILEKKYKISVTQSNISRILKQIKAINKIIIPNKKIFIIYFPYPITQDLLLFHQNNYLKGLLQKNKRGNFRHYWILLNQYFPKVILPNQKNYLEKFLLIFSL